MERLSEREKDEIARLAAAGLRSRLIGHQIGRHHRTVWGHIARLRRPVVPEPVPSALRLSLAEREEMSRGRAVSRCGRSRGDWAGRRGRSRARSPRMVDGGGIARARPIRLQCFGRRAGALEVPAARQRSIRSVQHERTGAVVRYEGSP
jgi:hypothetical protein